VRQAALDVGHVDFLARLHLQVYGDARRGACLALFWLLVVWPVTGPIASGELVREFGPLVRVLAAWVG
jgi:hypothetical protein